ncbi:MAG: hypothetical protein M3Q81_01930 [bacterium]|nr:hypothetical protein [bacterium]
MTLPELPFPQDPQVQRIMRDVTMLYQHILKPRNLNQVNVLMPKEIDDDSSKYGELSTLLLLILSDFDEVLEKPAADLTEGEVQLFLVVKAIFEQDLDQVKQSHEQLLKSSYYSQLN